MKYTCRNRQNVNIMSFVHFSCLFIYLFIYVLCLLLFWFRTISPFLHALLLPGTHFLWLKLAAPPPLTRAGRESGLGSPHLLDRLGGSMRLKLAGSDSFKDSQRGAFCGWGCVCGPAVLMARAVSSCTQCSHQAGRGRCPAWCWAIAFAVA